MIKAFLLTSLTVLLFAVPAQAQSSNDPWFVLQAINEPQASNGFRLTAEQYGTNRRELSRTAACITKVRKAYRKDKKKASNKAMRDRWESMLLFAEQNSHDGQLFALMAPQLLTLADNLEEMEVEDPALQTLTESGPAFIRQNLAMQKRYSNGWACRFVQMNLKSKQPIVKKNGRGTKAGNRLVSKSVGMSDRAWLKAYDDLRKLADKNISVESVLSEMDVSGEGIQWYEALLTNEGGFADYVIGPDA